jgi:hypothetical protein
MSRLFSTSDVVPDPSVFRDGCARFFDTYGIDACDIWFGPRLDWLVPGSDLYLDSELLRDWDCWLFFVDVCPHFSGWSYFCSSGLIYADGSMDAMSARMSDGLVSGDIRAAVEYARAASPDSVADDWLDA